MYIYKRSRCVPKSISLKKRIVCLHLNYKKINIDLNGLHFLKNLDCSFNSLENIPHLKELDCRNNELKCLDLSSNPQLKEKYYDDNVKIIKK